MRVTASEVLERVKTAPPVENPYLMAIMDRTIEVYARVCIIPVLCGSMRRVM